MFDFVEPTTSKLKVKVTMDDATKIITISGFNAKGNFNDAIAVLDAVLAELGGISYDIKSIKKISVWNVQTSEWVDIIFTAADIEPIFNGTYSPQGTMFTAADIEPIFNGTYTPQGTMFTAADIEPIFNGTHQLSY